ncbi:TetR family transcriptional regulator [Kribbella sp. NPDC048928]|uniref:TetR/AcrR family transcriptional regulator n=1 Tax=Kribbella sp. NPDC048928 TaxID=3364111 RepID=UPI00370F9452
MESGQGGKRSYSTVKREEQARETRARIVAAARELLLGEGYAAMTVPLLAKRAAVSPQTVYNSIGGKAEVVKAVYDVMLAGDEDPTPMSERPAFRAVTKAADASSYAVAYAAWVCAIWDRVGPLLGMILAEGPGGDRALEQFVATIEEERGRGNLAGLQGLPVGKEPSVVDAVWTLTAPEIYDRLVRRRGWSPQQYERWLARQLETAVAG